MYVIYTQDSCGFCVMAKELLENRGQEYTEIEIDQDNDAKNYIKTFANTVAIVSGFRFIIAICQRH